MFHRDYILRLIQMTGDLARRVAELMDELDQLKLLDEKCREHCGMSLQALEELSTESLCDMLAPKPRLIASEMLYLRASLPGARWEIQEGLLLKSMRLLASLGDDEGPLCEARLPRMRELKAALLPLLGYDDLMACARFFSQGESYGDMEDALFQAWPAAPPADRPGCAAEGARLLREAAHANEKTLALCGMTSHELRLSAREMEEMGKEGTPNDIDFRTGH